MGVVGEGLWMFKRTWRLNKHEDKYVYKNNVNDDDEREEQQKDLREKH